MNANELIEAYGTDVARRLPKRQRDDVAFDKFAAAERRMHVGAAE